MSVYSAMKFNNIRTNAKALYLINVSLEAAMDYLDAQVEKEWITEEEENEIIRSIQSECCEVTVDTCSEIYWKIVNTGRED